MVLNLLYPKRLNLCPLPVLLLVLVGYVIRQTLLLVGAVPLLKTISLMVPMFLRQQDGLLIATDLGQPPIEGKTRGLNLPRVGQRIAGGGTTVSYTHLTLPTKA